MTQAPTAAEVAGALSKAEARCVVAMTDKWQRAGKATFNGCVARYQLSDAIRDTRKVGATEHGAVMEYRLLPLGLAVRAILMEQDRHD